MSTLGGADHFLLGENDGDEVFVEIEDHGALRLFKVYQGKELASIILDRNVWSALQKFVTSEPGQAFKANFRSRLVA